MNYDPFVIEEGVELIRGLNEEMPVKAAFWLRRNKEDYKYLYIASNQIDSSTRAQAYHHLSRLLERTPSWCIDASRVLLISDQDRFAIAALKYNQHPNIATQLGPVPVGTRYISDGYIYPQVMSPNFPRIRTGQP